jgi:hypothetical protein
VAGWGLLQPPTHPGTRCGAWSLSCGLVVGAQAESMPVAWTGLSSSPVEWGLVLTVLGKVAPRGGTQYPVGTTG